MTAEDIREGIKALRAAQLPEEYCWKCGKAVYVTLIMNKEAAETMRDIGYDQSCCFDWHDRD